MNEIKQSFQFDNQGRGTISLQSNSIKKSKLSLTPTSNGHPNMHFNFDLTIEPFETRVTLEKDNNHKSDSKNIQKDNILMNSNAEYVNSKFVPNASDKSKSPENLKVKYTKQNDNFLTHFNENYEDLVSTIRNLKKSGSFNMSKTNNNTPEVQTRNTIIPSTKTFAYPVVKSTEEPAVTDLISQAAKAEEEIKGLTNTEEISNFYEYTEDCMKRILKLKVPPFEEMKHLIISLPFEKDIIKKKKRLAIFDLDETLVHCKVNKPKKCHHSIEIKLPSKGTARVGLNVRPFWKESVMEIKKNYFTIIYTASHQSYADSVVDFLDPTGELFDYRLYRHNCVKAAMGSDSIYVKDLRIFKNIPLSDMIIIDNSILSFAFQLENGIPIVPFYENSNDTELKFLAYFLNAVAQTSDLRVENKKNLRLDYFFQKAKEEEENTSYNDNMDKSSNVTQEEFIINPIIKSNTQDVILLNNVDTSTPNETLVEVQNVSSRREEEDSSNIATPKLPKMTKRMSVFQGELLNTFNDMKRNFTKNGISG